MGEKGINARIIMNNNLSRMTAHERSNNDLPYLIQYPTFAAESTYIELARRKPQMTPQVLRVALPGIIRICSTN
jgi:hypothetical protein